MKYIFSDTVSPDASLLHDRIVGADPALVIAEDHIQNPMKAIFDRPMTTDDRPQLRREENQ